MFLHGNFVLSGIWLVVMKTLLKKHIEKYLPVSENLLDFLADNVNYIRLKPGEIFLKNGKVADRIGLLQTGILRAFTLDDQTNEITSYFYYLPHNDVVTLHTSFSEGKPANHCVEAISSSEIISFHKSVILEAESGFPEMNHLRRLIAEQQYLQQSKRINNLQTKSARELYNCFVKESGDLVLNVPQHMIASYLGMSQYTLSKIKKQ